MTQIVPAYAPPSSQIPSAAGRFLRCYSLFLFITFLPCVLCLTVMLGVAPVFGSIFRDFKTTLPVMTEWLLDISDFFRAGGWIVPIIAAIGIAFIPTTITARIPDRAHRVICLLIYLILVQMFLLLAASTIVMALSMPMVKIIQSVSGGGGSSLP